MSAREINEDTVGSLLANTTNAVTIALAESWLDLLKKNEELDAERVQLAADLSCLRSHAHDLEDRLFDQGAELDENQKALADWEDKCSQLEYELRELQEERGGHRSMPYGREREPGAW